MQLLNCCMSTTFQVPAYVQARVNLKLYKDSSEKNLSYLSSLLLGFNVKIPLGLYFCHIICNFPFAKSALMSQVGLSLVFLTFYIYFFQLYGRKKKKEQRKLGVLTSFSCFISNKQQLKYHLFLIAEDKKKMFNLLNNISRASSEILKLCQDV